MLNLSALRFLAFLPDRLGDKATRVELSLATAVATRDPNLTPVRHAVGFSLWTAKAPVDVPVVVEAGDESCSVGWIFTGARPGSSPGRWGGFVTFTRDSRSGWSVLRSVDGQMTACAIRVPAGLIVASQVPAWLFEAADVVPEVDWTVIAAMLGDPTVAGHQSALRGVTMIPPGCRLEFRAPTKELLALKSDYGVRLETVWDPCALAADARPLPMAVAEERLRDAVDESVGAWSGVAEHVLLELSGGLDSSILAGTLSCRAPDRRATFVNASTVQAGGDERRYAREVAELCGRPLVEIAADPRVLDIARLRDLVHPSEPILYGLDAGHDTQIAAHAVDVGADTIFTGQGGDAIFYQMPDLSIAVDAFRLWGPKSLWSRHTRDIASRAQRSVWSAWAAMLADQFGRPSLTERFPSPLTTPAAAEHAAADEHPSLTGLSELPPAKARQVVAIANSQIFYGPTRRGQSTLFVHPLLSQPVIETCLSIPIPILTGGRGDRQRARSAFVHRLPESVARRRSKGEAASHYNNAVTDGIADLRSLLLDGRLVTQGLLDRSALEQALQPETLLWSDLSRPLMLYASIEAWIRYWEGA